jgi:hypothetical protein
MHHVKYSVDECSEILRTRGWAVKESSISDPNCPEYWRIDCVSGHHSFVVLAPVGNDAWNQALQAALHTNGVFRANLRIMGRS